MEFRPDTPGRKRSLKHLLLGMLLLINLFYLCAIIVQSPEIIRPSSTGLSTQLESSFLRGDANLTSSVPEPTRSTNLQSNSSHVRRLKCLGWRATKDCSPDGDHIVEGDQDCNSKIPFGSSGYCEVEDEDTHEKLRVMKRTCSKGKLNAVFRCADAPGFVNFHTEAHSAIRKNQTTDIDHNSSRGIVMVVYPKLVASAYATIRVLRNVYDCRLPIEIWYRPNEMGRSSVMLDVLKSAGNDSLGGITFEEINHPRARRFNAKIYAVQHSKFDQILFLDADNVPVKDPSYLFEIREFVNTGAVFWPDYWHPDNTIFYVNKASLVWELLDTPFVDMFEQESGQLLIDRRKHAAALDLVAFYGLHQPNYFDRLKLVWGDKDLFRLAWLKLGASFHMIEAPPATAGRMYGGSFCGMTMVQHDAKGAVLFLHRNQMKLTGEPNSKMVQADEHPDPVMWTHLMSFRKGSPRSKYVIQGHSNPQFSQQRRCFGREKVDGDSYFFLREFSDLSFTGLEKNLRRYAKDAVMKIRSYK